MIKKLLFTLLVAIAVLGLYKLKTRSNNQSKVPSHQHRAGKMSAQLIAYIMVGFLMLFSSLYFALNWFDEKNHVTVRVINTQNQITQYQVKKSNLKGRTFTTLDGRRIELGSNERLEILP